MNTKKKTEHVDVYDRGLTLENLKAAPYNPRRISAKAAKALAKSIGDYGDLSVITWNHRTGNLVCGHQRVTQLRKLGAKMVGGKIVSPSGEEFVVRVVDWPEQKERAANIIANHTAIGGEFTDQLSEVLDGVILELGEDGASELLLDDLVSGDGGGEDEALKEWDASELSLQSSFVFTAHIELQAKIRAVLEREFPGVSFSE